MSQGQGGIVAWVGFPEWVRGPARIADGEVVLDEDRAERYAPHSIDQAIFELAAANGYQDFRAFVRRYGLLWHGPDSLGTGACRESVSDWQKAAYEAATVVLLHMKLREAARKGSADPVRFLNMTWEGVPETLNDKDYLEQVSMVLAELVNNHVIRYPTVLIPAFRFEDEAEPGQFVFGRQPPSLHAALYTEFATMIAQRAELKECLGCGRIFPPQSGKQRYCTKSCANTSRWHRWKDRQAE
ncbi:MAG: hypothetical protein LC751_03650 [Actinobacteria bacterium]|nr:hypothetical protein [Actinomycetota bacterium]